MTAQPGASTVLWPPDKRSLPRWLMLAAIAGLAAYLRLASPLYFDFGHPDEGAQLVWSVSVMRHGTIYPVGASEPLLPHLQAVLFMLFGFSLPTAVTINAVFSILCVLAVFLVGLRVYGFAAGSVAAALVATSPWHIVLARSALRDSGNVLAAALCLLAGAYLASSRNRWRIWAFGVVSGLALLTRLTTAFAVLACLVWLLWPSDPTPARASKPKRPRSMLRDLVPAALPPLVLWLLYSYWRYFHVKGLPLRAAELEDIWAGAFHTWRTVTGYYTGVGYPAPLPRTPLTFLSEELGLLWLFLMAATLGTWMLARRGQRAAMGARVDIGLWTGLLVANSFYVKKMLDGYTILTLNQYKAQLVLLPMYALLLGSWPARLSGFPSGRLRAAAVKGVVFFGLAALLVLQSLRAWCVASGQVPFYTWRSSSTRFEMVESDYFADYACMARIAGHEPLKQLHLAADTQHTLAFAYLLAENPSAAYVALWTPDTLGKYDLLITTSEQNRRLLLQSAPRYLRYATCGHITLFVSECTARDLDLPQASIESLVNLPMK